MNKLVKVLTSISENNADSLESEDIKFVLTQSIEKFDKVASEIDEPLDYIIEKALEHAAAHIEDFKELKDVIEKSWLYLENFRHGASSEINVRSAEFLAKWHDLNRTTMNTIKSLAVSVEWQERLVAGWYIRDHKSASFQNEIELLKVDPFEDDDGNFLVRESIGEDNG